MHTTKMGPADTRLQTTNPQTPHSRLKLLSMPRVPVNPATLIAIGMLDKEDLEE